MLKVFLIAFSILTLSGCTITIAQSVADTHGSEDTVSDDQETHSSTDVEADLDIPIKTISTII
jgi:uncharacterized protein YceK